MYNLKFRLRSTKKHQPNIEYIHVLESLKDVALRAESSRCHRSLSRTLVAFAHTDQ